VIYREPYAELVTGQDHWAAFTQLRHSEIRRVLLLSCVTQRFIVEKYLYTAPTQRFTVEK
jgi:hypothetical protein